MNLTESQRQALKNLYTSREKIEDILAEIEANLQVYFSEEFSVAYQHWLPQIKTALRDGTKWLPRGQYSMEYTLDRISDHLVNDDKGVTKYI
jgi:hypothetical protein